VQEAVQAGRLLAVPGCVQPRHPEQPAPDPDGGARPLPGAALPQVVPLRRRVRRVLLATGHVQWQRRAELMHVIAYGQLRVAAVGEPGAEAGGVAGAGADDRAGAGAGAHEAVLLASLSRGIGWISMFQPTAAEEKRGKKSSQCSYGRKKSLRQKTVSFV
jgi:hypothetical protein